MNADSFLHINATKPNKKKQKQKTRSHIQTIQRAETFHTVVHQ